MIPPTQITTKMNETNAKIYLPIDLFLPVFQSKFSLSYKIPGHYYVDLLGATFSIIPM